MNPPTEPWHATRSQQFSITPQIDFTNQTLTLETKDISGRITREIMNLKESAIRQSLMHWIASY